MKALCQTLPRSATSSGEKMGDGELQIEYNDPGPSSIMACIFGKGLLTGSNHDTEVSKV
jgi:hypothetical protein